MSMQKISDPYRTLGVSRGATEAEIKAAHRQLVKRYHPDTGTKSETERFLRVQEAYRVLSDPLLRREWDARHAPGPVRAERTPRQAANRQAAARPAAPRPAAPRPAAPRPAASRPASRRQRPDTAEDPRTQPRSKRAYTWSAGEVPWWEDRGRRASDEQSGAESGGGQGSPTGDQREFNAAQDFDVYDRSSGAAWSMAARAYFRKGDQDLPRRGSWHYQGSQPVTAGRARTAAQQEARRRATAATAEARPADAKAPPAGTRRRDPDTKPRQAAGQAAPPPPAARQTRPADARPPSATTERQFHQAREQLVRRALPVAWPSMGQRLTFALVAWLPVIAIVGLAAWQLADEIVPVALAVLVLALLVALPRVAYVAGAATIGLLIVGLVFIGMLAIAGVRLPLDAGLSVAVGVVLLLGYAMTAVIIVLGPPGLRPWSATAGRGSVAR